MRRVAAAVSLAVLAAPLALADIKICKAPILSADLSGCEPVEGVGESFLCEGEACTSGETFDQTKTRLFSCSNAALRRVDDFAASPAMTDEKTILVTGKATLPIRVRRGSDCFPLQEGARVNDVDVIAFARLDLGSTANLLRLNISVRISEPEQWDEMRLRISNQADTRANEHGLFALKEVAGDNVPGIDYSDWYADDPEFGLVFISQARSSNGLTQQSSGPSIYELNSTWVTFALGNGLDVTVRQSNLDLTHWRVLVGATRDLELGMSRE
jgi:hypothetical protein